MIIIYTRTSSKTTFKKDSPNRQNEVIITQNNQAGKQIKKIKEQCKASLPLKDRPGFNQIIRLAKNQKIYQHMESLSRLGRDEDILKEFNAINKELNYNIVPNLAIGTNVIFNPSSKYDEARKYAIDVVSKEAIFKRTSQNKAKERAKAKGEKFDGRKNLLELHPKLTEIKKNLPYDMSQHGIAVYLYNNHNIKTSKNNPLAKSSIKSIFNRLNIRRFSTQISNRQALLRNNYLRFSTEKSNKEKNKDKSIKNKIINKLSQNIIFNADDNNYYIWNNKYWESIQINTLLNYLYKYYML